MFFFRFADGRGGASVETCLGVAGVFVWGVKSLMSSLGRMSSDQFHHFKPSFRGFEAILGGDFKYLFIFTSTWGDNPI